MRVAHYLIREPSGLFYFRLRVPLDLRALVGRRLIKRATGARCPRQALTIATATAWASGYYPQGDNPTLGHANVSKKNRKQRAKTHGWQAFNADQVRRIFDPETYASLRSEAARWLPLMALYRGETPGDWCRDPRDPAECSAEPCVAV